MGGHPFPTPAAPVVPPTARGAAVELVSQPRRNAFPAGAYELHSPDHFWFQWRLKVLLRACRSAGLATDRPLRALDVGGGTGVMREQLERSSSWIVDLSDLSLDALRAAPPGRGRVLYYDVLEERAGFAGAYDVAVLFDVLEHIESPAPFLDAVLRHLTPGGWLLLNVPALPALFSRYDAGAGHHRRYLKRGLLHDLARVDADVVDVRYWGLGLVPLAWLRRWLGRSQSDEEAVRAGLQPPGRLAHALLRALMHAETGLLDRPAIGTSLMLIARRRPAAS